MERFLLDGEISYTYDSLLKAVCEEGYTPFLKTHDLFAYFSNLVKALANNQSLTLLDADLNETELSGVTAEKVNQTQPLIPRTFHSIAELIEALQQSQSEITIFTSGTTGQPKKVVHSVTSLSRSVRRGEKYLHQVWGYAYNPTHMAGLQVFFQAFENQNTLVNVFNRSRAVVYECVQNYGVTHISATPTFYRMLLPFEKAYPGVQRVTLGGEKSDAHLYDAIHKIFPSAKINNVYASTEAGSLFAAKGDCFQIPTLISDKFKVVDEELLIHQSLLGRSDSFNLDGEYYHSGDLIEWVDEKQGLFRFKSRKNELINVGGYKVNPGEVEAVVNSLDGVKQSLVFGKTNSVLGNVLCAEVQLEEHAVMTELDIRKALKDKLQDFKIPRRIKFVEAFTLTRTGKLKR
jgi:acyl-coenzyme A synthetase/AMP-(fatty) acid ligase